MADAIPSPRPERMERFWQKVQKQPDGCWIWTGSRNDKGYGKFVVHKTSTTHLRYAHRYAYHVLVEPIPEGMVIDHLCRNRACVNPMHLEPVTTRENLRRGEGCRQDRPTCAHGHPRTAELAVRRPDGSIRCLACERQHAAKRRAKKKAPVTDS